MNGSSPAACLRRLWQLGWAIVAGYGALPAALAASAVAVLVEGPPGRSGFESLPPGRTGITFTNALTPADAARNQILLNGSGVAASDIDADGWVDLYFPALQGGGRLYRNLGDWRFAEATEASGTALAGAVGTGAAFADVDGDGDADLLVNTLGGGTRLLVNDGVGRFREREDAGLLRRFGATSMALADIDLDGDLDLFVGNYRTNTIRSTGFFALNVNGQRRVRPEDRDRLEYLPDGRILEHGEPDVLYRNDGGGRFTPVPWTEGAFRDATGAPLREAPRDWTLAVAFRDVNADGAPDLYVCGDFHSPDHLWLNDGRGNFRAAPPESWRNMPTFSMSVDFADLDRDGHDDFVVADMRDPRHEMRVVQSPGAMMAEADYETLRAQPQLARNVVQHNRGDGSFAEIACFAGLEASGWTWSTAFLDVDLDGYEDLLTATGHLFDTQDLDAQERIEAKGPYRMDQIPGKLLQHPPLLLTKWAFRNRGDRRFEERSQPWSWAGEPGVWQGLCLADLDQDGDLDVVVSRLNGPVGMYRNASTAPRVWVQLKGAGPNTRGIGARLELAGGAVARQTQEMMAGGRYLSGDDPARVFAAGTLTNDLRLRVRWPSGRVTTAALQPNHRYTLEEASAAPAVPDAVTPSPARWMEDVSDRLGHRHYDAPFDDRERQPLISRWRSQAGPGVGWIDFDGNGREDLVITAGRGGRTGLFINDERGGFRLAEPEPASVDQVAVTALAGGKESVALVSGTGYEEGDPAKGGVWTQRAGGSVERLADVAGSSTGPVSLADVDGDGDLDLLLLGGPVGGRYPEAAPSRLYLREGARWTESAAHREVLAGVGLVNGAVWTDFDGDGDPDLVLACEWGPVRMLVNEGGRLTDRTEALGLGAWRGWWTGIQAGDVDGDGRVDLVVGNWGLNTLSRATMEHPVRLYHGDLAGLGQVELVEASYEASLGRWVPDRDLHTLSRQLPWLREQFPTHRAFAAAAVEDVLARSAHPPRMVSATTLASTVFLQRDGRFEALPLPDEVQWSSVTGVSLADFDLDGRLDLYLAQNWFAVAPVLARQDAGRGLMLRGLGNGRFQPLPAQESGVAIPGDQRGSAVGDFDADGRPDLVVGLHRAETRLLRNRGTAPGVRVRLRGSQANPAAVGAQVRVRTGDGYGGWMREIQAGSGYGSQDSWVLCVPAPPVGQAVEIHWPGGRITRHVLSSDASTRTLDLTFPE